MTGSARGPLHIASVFATFAVGGPQVRFAALANRFGAAWRHTILAMDGNHACRERLDPGLDVAYLDVPGRKGATFGNLREFRRLLQGLRPDLLVTHNWGSIEWAMANWPPVVRHIHIEDGFGPEERDHQLRRRVLTRRLVLARSQVVVPSRTLERIATERWRLDRRRVHTIPNGIDLTRFARPRDEALQAHFPGGGPVVGTVAALRPEKNLSCLLRAFQAASATTPARLVIVGDGPERSGLERLADDLGLGDRIRFAGHMSDPAPFCAGFDLFALSSDTEQMPLSVVEAMAAGLPVASTDVGDLRLMLASENAPFVGARSYEALARSIRDLLDDRSLRARVGAANRVKAAREYDQDSMFRAYAALFEGTTAGPASRARTA
ncbi:MAG: glycosyltransferase family 4 protein [Pseudomonadota bacterium]|nr:glycosyltransferase family 4 protein [Pseudomonadota bacterium]